MGSLLQEAKDLLAATDDGAAECWAQRNLYQTAASALALLAAMVVEVEELQADGEWQRGYDTGVIAAGGALTILTEAEKEANHE